MLVVEIRQIEMPVEVVRFLGNSLEETFLLKLARTGLDRSVYCDHRTDGDDSRG